MLKIVIALASSIIIISFYSFFNIRISIESTLQGVNSLIVLQSIILGIYSVSLSIIAALHDTTLIKKLLRPNSVSRNEIQNINNSAFLTIIISLSSLIIFLFFFEIIIKYRILVLLFQFIIPFCIMLSLLYIYDFFKIINAVLFKYSDHE
ncbi:hypothetical protein [Abyssicoccus albus]|uniref:Uncharacterized protein n=1 Tax=Abyssicoccus albus TaxID=1817405 RepID=A0A3N5BIW3_9BACL|nr:hypothetical protein [Abyssicoccus albus]RPF57764.1 hypothetical protein EDD62_0398 [Abyssicoccus albus]